MPDFVAPLDPLPGWSLASDSEVLPATVRYPGRRVATLRATTPTATGRVVAPALGLLRVHPAPTGGVVLELEPMPFAMPTTLAALRGGLPSFFLGIASANLTDFSGIADSLVPRGETLKTLAAGDVVRIAVLAQDRVTRPPAAWSAQIRDAMAADPSPSWNDFVAAIATATGGPTAPVFVLDGAGRPLVGVPITVQVGATSFVVTLADAHGGDLQRAVIASGRPGLWTSAATVRLSIAPLAESHRWVQWRSGTPSDGSVEITPADPHVLVTDLDRWFAPQHVQGVRRPDGTPYHDLRRYTHGNKVDFYIDGGAFFRELVSVGRSLPEVPNSWLIVSSWGIDHDFQLTHRRGATPSDPTLLELLKDISNRPGASPVAVRFLLNQFIQIENRNALLVGWVLALLLTGGGAGLGEGFKIEVIDSDSVGLGALALALTAITVYAFAGDLRGQEKNESSYDAFNAPELDPLHVRAVWSRNPVTIADNPHAGGLPIELEDAGAIHFGVHHTKAMVARRDSRLIAWVGGMDIVPNRRDDPRRVVESPYHDLQARVEGPAAEDVAHSLRDRWDFDAAREVDTQPDPPPTELPQVLITPVEPLPLGTEIVQVARTYPRIGDPDRQLTFAPNGDFTIHDTLIQALAQAREYIYIEDQYFNPGSEYRAALLAAIPNVERLICILPAGPDQPLGDLHRRQFIQELKAAGGDKVIIRAPIRRPTLPVSRRRASYGRLISHAALGAVPGFTDEVLLGPDARLPHAPFWLVIDGESMLAMEQLPTVASDPAGTQRFRVKRGSAAAPGIHTRAHEAGAPAAIANRTGIYVHAKMMIVDDLFLSIGSANLNRRGLKHDGEMNIFAMPERLDAAQDNIARRLRIALWAAHLDLPLDIAAPLLADPIRGSALFLREYERGNRAVEIDTVDIKNVIPSVMTPGASYLMLLLSTLGLTLTGFENQEIWDTIADPTTEDL